MHLAAARSLVEGWIVDHVMSALVQKREVASVSGPRLIEHGFRLQG
jgi:hypothetical protein